MTGKQELKVCPKEKEAFCRTFNPNKTVHLQNKTIYDKRTIKASPTCLTHCYYFK